MTVANSQIADAIDRNSDHKVYDEYCKTILRNKQVLAHIMKACIPEFHDIPLEEIPIYIEHDILVNKDQIQGTDKIRGMNTEDINVHGARIDYDILFTAKIPVSQDDIGLLINMEAQAKGNPGYPLLSRAVYYGCRLVAGQKNRSEGFWNSDFGKLKKVYSIWIVKDASREKAGVFNRYTLKEECLQTPYHFKKEDYDKLCIIVIYPDSQYDLNDENHSFMELLHILFKAKMDVEDKKSHLSQNYGILITEDIGKEIEEMCNLSQSILDEGIAEGLAKGLAEGRIEGIAEGEMKERVLNVKSLMKALKIDVDKALEILDISDDLRPIVKEKLS